MIPNDAGDSFFKDKDTSYCGAKNADKKWYFDTFHGGVEKEIDHYDPRCRPWFYKQWNSTYSTYGEAYMFAGQDGRLGMSNCAPMWKKKNKNDASLAHLDKDSDTKGLVFYAAYCSDQ